MGFYKMFDILLQEKKGSDIIQVWSTACTYACLQSGMFVGGMLFLFLLFLLSVCVVCWWQGGWVSRAASNPLVGLYLLVSGKETF